MKKILTYQIFLLNVLIFFLISCSKPDTNVSTSGTITIPVLSTTSITGITENSAQSGGSISTDGGAAITARGICWSINANPTINDGKTMDGSGTGNFVSTMAGLDTSIIYYVRAYATNNKGTAYGNELSFKITPADKISGQFYGNGKEMQKDIYLGNLVGCVVPQGWDKYLLLGTSSATITKVNDNIINLTLSGGTFSILYAYANIPIRESASKITLDFSILGSGFYGGTAVYDINSKTLLISINTEGLNYTGVGAGYCLQGLPYYYGFSRTNNGQYYYNTVGHIDFSGTKQ